MNDPSESDPAPQGPEADDHSGTEGQATGSDPLPIPAGDDRPAASEPMQHSSAPVSGGPGRPGSTRPAQSWSPGVQGVRDLLHTLVPDGGDPTDALPAMGSPQLVRSIPPTAGEAYGSAPGTRPRRTSILQQPSSAAAEEDSSEPGDAKWGDAGPPPDFDDSDEDKDDGAGGEAAPSSHVELLKEIDATWSRMASTGGGDSAGQPAEPAVPGPAPPPPPMRGAPADLGSQELTSFLEQLNAKYQSMVAEPALEPEPALPGEGSWQEQTNAALRRLRLRPLPPGEPSLEAVKAALTGALRELQLQSGRAAEAARAAAEARRRDSDILGAADRREAELRAAKRAAQDAANAAEAEAARARDAELAAGARARRAEAEYKGLRRQLAAAEASVRGREKEAERLKAALAAKIDREEARAGRHREAYARLKRTAAAQGGGGRAVRDLRPVEITGFYEEQLEAAKAEAAQARAEAARMAEEVRRSMNSLREARDMAARAATAEERAADLEARLVAAEEGGGGGAGHRDAAGLTGTCQGLQAKAAVLEEELAGRPTEGELRDAEREAEALREELAEARSALRRARADSEEGGGDLAARVARRLGLGDRERMARDRAVHRLGLRAVEELPRAALVAALQDSCLALELRDAEQLPAALRKLVRVVAAVPKMEAFVGGCCEAVFRRGCAFLPPGLRGGGASPQQVPAVLEHWIAELARLAEHEEMRSAVEAHLALRAAAANGVGDGGQDMSTPEIVHAVKRLVEREQAALKAADTVAAAEEMLQSPAGLLEKIVLRFQDLFECPKLEDVLTTINQVFMIMEESRNFRRNLTALLGLHDGMATSPTLIAAVRRLLDRNGPHADLEDDYVARLEADQERHRARRQADEVLSSLYRTSPSPYNRHTSTGGVFQSPSLSAFSASPLPMRT